MIHPRHFILVALCALLAWIDLSGAQAANTGVARLGRPAPGFTLQGADGKAHALSDFKGKIIVLEWTNPDCPFVHKFYDSGTMQKLQKEATGEGVVWLRINSSAPGKEGAQTAAQLNDYIGANHVAATQSLLDPHGNVGHLYGARTTPHMFVIDVHGTLVYAGGIDDHPSPNPADIAGSKNFVTAALAEVKAGKPVTTASAPPYGCSVKYAE